MIRINIAKDFTDAPGFRHKDEGDFSGQEFREKFLEKLFSKEDNGEKIEINLDGVYGYATSFLEEAFGGLARKYGKEIVKRRLVFLSNEEPLLIKEIKSYIDGCDA